MASRAALESSNSLWLSPWLHIFWGKRCEIKYKRKRGKAEEYKTARWDVRAEINVQEKWIRRRMGGGTRLAFGVHNRSKKKLRCHHPAHKILTVYLQLIGGVEGETSCSLPNSVRMNQPLYNSPQRHTWGIKNNETVQPHRRKQD